MTKILDFKDIWPQRVVIRQEVSWNDALHWLDYRADIMTNEDFTTFTFKEFGFKDKKLAMEFKLRFG